MIKEVEFDNLPRRFREVFSGCLGRPEQSDEVLKMYRAPERRLFAMRQGGSIVAVAGLKLHELEEPELLHLAVRKDKRRNGFGSALIKTMINSFMIDTLAVWTDEDAVGFYEKIGFNIVNEIRTLNGLIRYKLRFSRARSLGRLET
ncbi:MAG TPA: N-acetyltransferase [Mesotoga infera]|uniref:N-acetyltransferase n=1 Tax=Mesotoga infera TaxID=1236046 RepID=A0A7C1GT24_9BACT|nr:N-acetyltransferase [Mesotoga infera]